MLTLMSQVIRMPVCCMRKFLTRITPLLATTAARKPARIHATLIQGFLAAARSTIRPSKYGRTNSKTAATSSRAKIPNSLGQ